MGFWSSFGTSMADSASGGLMTNAGMVDYFINPLASLGYESFWEDSRENSIANQKASNDLALSYYPRFARAELDAKIKSIPELVKAQRLALEQAGYNPLLAVSSAAGTPMSTQLQTQPINTADGPRSGVRASSILDNMQREALIEQTHAQTKFIDQKTKGEGWVVKTLSRSEAMGLGANLIKTLGFNFHDSSQETFLVAYNTITGELRNLGDTVSGFGSTAPVSNAAEVQAIPVDWKTDKSPRYKFNPDDWELKPEYRK